MALICFGSVRSSPGVTATVLALAARWPSQPPAPVVIEADPDGGVLASRYGLGRAGESPGLTSLATAARRGLAAGEVWRHAQRLPGGLGVVVGPDGTDAALATLRSASETLGQWLAAQPDVVALVDCGRLRPGSPALTLARASARLVVVVRPRVEELQALAQRLPALGELSHVSLVLVGDHPYGPEEVRATLGAEVAGVIAHDRRGAEALEGGASAKVLRRSTLARSAAALAEAMAAWPAIAHDSSPAVECTLAPAPPPWAPMGSVGAPW